MSREEPTRGFPPAEFEQRLERAQRLMADAGIDALLLTTEAMIAEQLRSRLTNHVAWVEHLGLDFYGYEGGPHLYAPSSDAQIRMMDEFKASGWAGYCYRSEEHHV